MGEILTELHPLEPWYPEGATLLMCGTFTPPRDRWAMDFYYPNFINDMWRIFGYILHGDKEYYVDAANKTFRLEAIKEMLTARHIAFTDTARRVHRTRGNASDKYLNIVQPTDLAEAIAALPKCAAIATTGEKAASVVATSTGTTVPRTGEKILVHFKGVDRPVMHWRMPSTSRAYPMSVEKKAEFYRCLFTETGII